MKKRTFAQLRARKKRKERRRRMLAKLGLKPTPRLPSIKSLKARLDFLFSRYIRKRLAFHGRAECVTCRVVQRWTEMNAGHFIKRQFLATRYDTRNCHVQCVQCNLYRGGNLIEYYAFMLRQYGDRVIDELRALARTTAHMKRADYVDLIGRFETWE